MSFFKRYHRVWTLVFKHFLILCHFWSVFVLYFCLYFRRAKYFCLLFHLRMNYSYSMVWGKKQKGQGSFKLVTSLEITWRLPYFHTDNQEFNNKCQHWEIPNIRIPNIQVKISSNIFMLEILPKEESLHMAKVLFRKKFSLVLLMIIRCFKNNINAWQQRSIYVNCSIST